MPDEIQDQIAAMLDYEEDGEHHDDGPESGDDPQDPGVDDSQGVETQGADEDSEEVDGAQASSEKDEEAPATDDDSASDPSETLKAENEALKARLEEVLRSQKGEAAKEVEPLPKSLDFDPFENVDVEELMDDAGKLKDHMKGAFAQFYDKVREQMIQNIPELMRSYANETISHYDRAQEFFRANEDLKPYKSYLGHKMNEIVAAEPELALDKVLEKAGNAVREDLHLSKIAADNARGEKPALPKRGAKASKRSRKVEPKKNDMESEIDQMLQLVD